MAADAAIEIASRGPMSKPTVHIVITNSHGDNRGDEAAQRSMVRMLAELIPQARFTILTNSPKGLSMPDGVEVRPTFAAWNRRFPFLPLPMILLWLALRKLGMKLTGLNRFALFGSLDSIARADLVLSAPGGPYIGEIYRGHELSEHLLHLWIAEKLGKSVMIYGPSMGPFTTRRNKIRRRLLDVVPVITLRDPISKQYLDDLKISTPLVYVAADSAFQDSVAIDATRLDQILVSEEIFDPANPHIPLIGVTPAGARWNYRNAAEPKIKQAEYVALMARTVDHLIESYGCRVVFFPQLYGRSSDLPLIQSIVDKSRYADQVRILSDRHDSDIQQAVISRMDMMIANRYHSAIFAIKQAVPVVCIAYEHKAKGVMRQAGVEDYLIDIGELSFDTLSAAIRRAWENRQAIRRELQESLPILRKSARTSSLAVLVLCHCAQRGDLNREKLAAEIEKLLRLC
jgi:colanic acid/amylovoran biosynthesis protein